MNRVLYRKHLEAILVALGSRPAGDAPTREAFDAINEFCNAHKGGSAAPRAVLLTKFEAQCLSHAAGNSINNNSDGLDIMLSPSRLDAARAADEAVCRAGHKSTGEHQ